eukprot:CAMPEP_0182911610 /NCGR_PEP_ID=MMETSP0034_2-20130328/37038_1 /TAXON_ID=156128 /ORGANISM="Nephroselmis pyriformis, Strain CCMP717" /LENGTH=46 /DNA_ID= /DNA_START= /DNA_END= /DNA_ORIENTATION=
MSRHSGGPGLISPKVPHLRDDAVVVRGVAAAVGAAVDSLPHEVLLR